MMEELYYNIDRFSKTIADDIITQYDDLVRLLSLNWIIDWYICIYLDGWIEHKSNRVFYDVLSTPYYYIAHI